jgi:hypothetical protein
MNKRTWKKRIGDNFEQDLFEPNNCAKADVKVFFSIDI